jgi:hypothetical protein
MWNRLQTVLCCSALCFGFAATSAHAAESRVANFLFPCTGANQAVTFNVSGLGSSVNRFIQGAEIALFENNGGLQYVVFSAQGDPNKVLLAMSAKDNRASNQYNFSTFVVQTSPIGTVQMNINGACNTGFGQVQGTAIVFLLQLNLCGWHTARRSGAGDPWDVALWPAARRS